jgi:hypothetical protein
MIGEISPFSHLFKSVRQGPNKRHWYVYESGVPEPQKLASADSLADAQEVVRELAIKRRDPIPFHQLLELSAGTPAPQESEGGGMPADPAQRHARTTPD